MTNEGFINSIKLENEEWRDVVGYEGCYMVSSYGRVISLSRYVERFNYAKWTEPILMHQHRKQKGYFTIVFKRNGVKKCYSVHRVVAAAFVPNPNNYPCIDHINDNPLDNRACNLQWCTHKMNNSKEHHRISASKAMRGTVSPNRRPVARLSLDWVLLQIYPSMTHAEQEGYSHSAIHKAIHNKSKTHGGCKWMYLEEYENLVNKSKNSQSASD